MMFEGRATMILSFAKSMRPYDASHAFAVVLTVLVTFAFVSLRRRSSMPQAAQRTDRVVAVLVALGWLANFVVDALPGRFDIGQSLPLHICDVVGLFAIAAIATSWRPARAITFLWGWSLCIFAFVMPVITAGPWYILFWSYFGGHGAIVLAAAYDAVARQYRPTRADLRSALVALVIYVLTIVPINMLLGVNYGYLGKVDGDIRPIEMLGPWPWRIPVLMLIAATLATLLYKATRAKQPTAPTLGTPIATSVVRVDDAKLNGPSRSRTM